jgi:CRISPR/Cas system CMR-associated protein Cmr5 small subunit
MKNLEQIRAMSAIKFADEVASGQSSARGAEGGEAIKKIPPMIMANGLLAALAFALEVDRNGLKRAGYASIFSALAKHLASSEIDITRGVTDASSLIRYLTQSDSATLKLATAEALEWLGYARRFVKPPEKKP